MYLCSASSSLMLHETNTWSLKKCYKCYEALMRDISWSDDSKYILQINSKGSIEILSPMEHDVRSLQHVPIKDTWSATFHREGHRYIAVGTKGGNVMIWDTKNKTITKSFPPQSQQNSVNFISYNAKNTSLAATLQNGDTVIYGLVSNIPVLTVKLLCSKSISAMKFHHESRSLLGLVTDEGHVLLRDITTNKDKAFFENAHASPVSDFTYSLINRDVMLSSGYDKIMNVYDVRLKNVVSTIRTSYTLTSLAINHENEVALGTKNGSVLIYDLRDTTNPLKVLKDHEEEIRKVAFQPMRKKAISTEVSLGEDSKVNLIVTSPFKTQSPVRNRASDMFFINDTPPKQDLELSGKAGETTADSFLVMMGLNKSNNDLDEDKNKSAEFEHKHEKSDFKNCPISEKTMTKISTPLNARLEENFRFPSPICLTNGIPDTARGSNLTNLNQASTNIDKQVMEELKDFIKLSLGDVVADNRNYFLHIMMALTKQKLYLEKQLAGMNEQIHTLVQNQSALVETYRKLVLEVDQLKAAQHKSKST